MGMFDTIRCEYPLPGLDDPTHIEFQTKSLDSSLDEYKITAAGKLMFEEYDVEDRSDPNATGWYRFVGSCTKVPTGWKQVDFTGTLNFYGDINSGNLFLISPNKGTIEMIGANGETIPAPKAEWFEFDATFDHGNLTAVVRRPRYNLNPEPVQGETTL